MMMNRKRLQLIFSLAGAALLVLFILLSGTFLGSYEQRIFNLCGIYIILALSLNLVNGFTGLFSLGHSGFMALGTYVSALLIAGLAAALAGFLIGTPVLRLRDDYLAIATLGFSEIIRVVITNLQTVTNGALGLKGLPKYVTTPMIWFIAILTTVFMAALVRSSFGRSCKAVRDNEIAAQAIGIHIARIKIQSFVISSSIAGVGGAQSSSSGPRNGGRNA